MQEPATRSPITPMTWVGLREMPWRLAMRVDDMRLSSAALTVLVLLFLSAVPAAGQQPATSKTQIVLLGTGNPGPDPDRSGPATAIIVNGTAYLVDFGPGIVRRASAAF